MKKLLSIITFIAFAGIAIAQTPEEIISRMEAEMAKAAPKKMTLIVAKGTYMPVSLSASVSLMTITMRDLSYGVTEKQVTFNPEDYPNATIVDKR